MSPVSMRAKSVTRGGCGSIDILPKEEGGVPGDALMRSASGRRERRYQRRLQRANASGDRSCHDELTIHTNLTRYIMGESLTHSGPGLPD